MVFPELRERMAKRNFYSVDVDLRWGVTEEEAKQGKDGGLVRGISGILKKLGYAMVKSTGESNEA